MPTILEKAINQEKMRREKSAEEITKLIGIVNHAVKEAIKSGSSIDQIKAECSTILSSDLKNIKELNALNKPRSSIFQLDHNQLELLFSNVEGHPGAIDFINKHLSVDGFEVNIDSESKASHDIDFGLKDNGIYKFGNSSINYIQIALLTILRAIKEHDFTKQIITGEQLAQDGSRIYNVDESPVIQGVKLPQKIIDSLSDSLKNWFYILSGELLTPNLGYAFGGSRNESRYYNKVFKTHDCSSHLGELLGLDTPVSTFLMDLAHKQGSGATAEYKEVFEGFFSKKEERAENEKYIENILNVLKPIDSVEVGDVIVSRSSQGGYCGIITEIEEGGNGIRVAETLSYNRDIPLIEGLGYNRTEWKSGAEVTRIGSQYSVKNVNEESAKTYSFFRPINEFNSENSVDLLGSATFADETAQITPEIVDTITTEL